MPQSRRRPWPFDLNWSGTGLMLARNSKGDPKLEAVKAQTLPDQPQPGDTLQEDSPPIIEIPHAWGDLSFGFGLGVDPPVNVAAHKYSHAMGVDCSIGGYIMKGPLITTCTPATLDSTNGITQFIELPNGVLLAMNGRYVQKRASDDTVTGWGASPVHDFTAGFNCLNAVVHQSDGGTPANPTIYAAMNSTHPAQYCSDNSGAAWTAFATHVSIDYFTVSRELWRASDVNFASKCDAASDPTVEANWSNSASFRIGDKQYPINQVRSSSVGFPLFFKQDGIYTLDTTGQDSRLYPWFQFGASSEDGLYSWDFGNDTHVTYGNTHVKLVPTEGFSFPRVTLQPSGPERSLGNTSVVHGRLTAGVGDGTMFAYVGLYNSDTNTSYLLKFSSYLGEEVQPGKTAESQRIDAWHGSISQAFVGKKITAMHRSRVGASTGHFRCYMGFSDGTIAWFELPCTANPLLCAAAGNYKFDNTVDGTLNLSLFHASHMANAKSIRGFTMSGTQLTATEYVKLNYRLNSINTSYTTLQDAAGVDIKFDVTPSKRADFQSSTSSTLIDIQLILHNTFTTLTPVLTTPTLHYAVVTPVALRYQGVIDGSITVRRDGRPTRLASPAIRSLIKSSAQSTSGIQITLPDETTKTFSVINYGERLSWSERTEPWSALIPFEIVEFHPNIDSTGATHVTGIIANLEPFLVIGLDPFLISDLDGV